MTTMPPPVATDDLPATAAPPSEEAEGAEGASSHQVPGDERDRPSPVTAVLGIVMSFSVVIGFFGLYAYGLSAIQEQRSQQQLYEQLRGLLDPSSPVAPYVGGDIPSGAPIGLVSAPGAGLRRVVVVEGTTSGDLLAGPGHLPNSPLPGEQGQAVLIGRSATAGAPFANVPLLQRSDRITVQTGQGTFHFVVLDRRVAGSPLPALPKSGGLLTLVTSSGTGFVGSLAPSRLVYVDAALVGKPAQAGSAALPEISPAEIQGHGDPSAWIFLVLWLQALLTSAGGTVWLWWRWGRWQTWLVGGPVLLAALWGVSTEVMRLLPNVW